MGLTVLFSVVVLGLLALLFGAGLSYAEKVFYVEQDERAEKIRALLPGANCGGCSFIGCDDFAKAVAEGRASVSACAALGDAAQTEIAAVMNIKKTAANKKIAVVQCGGCDKNSKFLYKYEGQKSCLAASQLSYGGAKLCRFGCIGEGSCAAVCRFGAITVENSLAFVDKTKCVGCGVCVSACPKKIIALIPADQPVYVACSSTDDGKTVTAACEVGCISCGICKKACAPNAVTINERLAKISADKCADCGECVKKCPRKIIYPVTSSS